MGEKVEEEKKAAERREEKEESEEEVTAEEEEEEEEEATAAAEEPEKKKKEAEGGEKKASTDDGEKKATDDGEKKATGPAPDGGEKTEDAQVVVVVVLKLDLHCDGCARKVRRAVYNFDGVQNVKADASENQLVVTGNVDPESLREQVEFRTRKTVELISPQPQKDGAGNKKKPDEKIEKKQGESPKEPVIITVVFDIRLHCQGCARKIKRTILKKFSDVEKVSTDLENNTVTVTGTMSVEDLASFLEERLKRTVEILEIVPPPQKADASGKKEEGKKEEAKAEEKKDEPEEDSDAGEDDEDGGEKVEKISKMEYAGFNPYTYYAMPIYNQSYSTSHHAVRYAPPPPLPTYVRHDYDYFIHDQYPVRQGYHYSQPQPHHGYANRGYPVGGPSVNYVNSGGNLDDRMLSDENPNGCSIM